MSSKRIADLPVKNPTDAMKIPTGGFGDYAVTLKSISEWLVEKYSLATKEELKLVDETLKSLIELKADKTSVYTKQEVDNIVTQAKEKLEQSIQLTDSRVGSLETTVDSNYQTLSQNKADKNNVVNSVGGRKGDVTFQQIKGGLNLGDLADKNEVEVMVDSKISTWSGIVQEEKNKENISTQDFGAAGDGVKNDTASFDELELAYQDRNIDLLGLSYVVNKIPNQNNYENGSFIVNGKEFNSVKPLEKSKHNKKIKLSIPVKFKNYDAVLIEDGANWYYPQGICFDESMHLYVSYSSNFGSSSKICIVKYDFETGEELGYLKAGMGYGEGFAVVGDFLYIRNSNTTSAPIEKYNLSGFDWIGGTPPLVQSYDVKNLYQFSYRNGYFYSENADHAIGSILDRTTITKYDLSFNPVGVLQLPFLYSGGSWVDDGSQMIKRQSFSVGDGFIVGGYGGLTSDTSGLYGIVRFNTNGDIDESLLYDQNKARAIIDSIKTQGVASTRIENEGVAVSKDNKIYSLTITNGVDDVGAYYYIVEHCSDDVFAKNFSSAAVSYTNRSNYDDYMPPRGKNGIMLNPITGSTMSTLEHIILFMRNSGCRKFTFYSTSFPNILDYTGTVLPSGNVCEILNANNGTFYYKLTHTTRQRVFIINGSPRTQTECTNSFAYDVIADGNNLRSLGTSGRRFSKTWTVQLSASGLGVYSDNESAKSDGLVTGDFYRTSDGTVKIVF
ncbi:MAG: hypothetical protein KBT03_07165 [Bacteroidales bacterium]|nr:hypothetical protein [Candidatus Scybalousia scybalohippi]